MYSMAVDSPGTAAAGATQDRGLGAMRSEDFFKIMITELQQQDPLAPSSTKDMINQVSQIRSIELSKDLSRTLDALSRQQKTAGLSDLIGKFITAQVTGDDGSRSEIAGIVTGVRFGPDGAAVLELDSGQTVAATDVTKITTPQADPLLAGLGLGGSPAAKPQTLQKPRTWLERLWPSG